MSNKEQMLYGKVDKFQSVMLREKPWFMLTSTCLQRQRVGGED